MEKWVIIVEFIELDTHRHECIGIFRSENEAKEYLVEHGNVKADIVKVFPSSLYTKDI